MHIKILITLMKRQVEHLDRWKVISNGDPREISGEDMNSY
jgi:hypothetical protein